MASAQVVKTSVTNNSPSQDSNHQDDLSIKVLPAVLYTSKLQYFTERLNLYLYPPSWLRFTQVTYNMTTSISFDSFYCFLYILFVHWAYDKIIYSVAVSVDGKFWICFSTFGAPSVFLLATQIQLLPTYLSQLVSKRQLLNFKFRAMPFTPLHKLP